MKTFVKNTKRLRRQLLLGLSLTGLSSILLSAGPKPNPMGGWNADKVMDNYVKTVSEGKTQWVEHLFTNDVEYQTDGRNERHGKKEILKFLKAMTGNRYDCVAQYRVLDEDATACIAKMTMQFETFTRTDYIYLSATNDGWKIRKILVGRGQKNGALG